MMLLLSTIFGMAILDSFNPSAIALIIIILTTGKNSIAKALAYVGGIFATCFCNRVLTGGQYYYN